MCLRAQEEISTTFILVFSMPAWFFLRITGGLEPSPADTAGEVEQSGTVRFESLQMETQSHVGTTFIGLK